MIAQRVDNIIYLLKDIFFKSPQENNKSNNIIIMYHKLHNVKNFIKQINYLKKTKNIVKFSDILLNYCGSNLLSITFDDGYDDVIKYFFSLKIPAAIYIVTSYINKSGYLTKNDIIEMAKSSYIEIGCHTHTHRKLSNLNYKDQYNEIYTSKAILEDLIGNKIESFAIPFGKDTDYNNETIEIVKSLGFKTCLTTNRGFLYSDTDLYQIPRIGVNTYMNISMFKHFLELDTKIADKVHEIINKIR